MTDCLLDLLSLQCHFLLLIGRLVWVIDGAGYIAVLILNPFYLQDVFLSEQGLLKFFQTFWPIIFHDLIQTVPVTLQQ